MWLKTPYPIFTPSAMIKTAFYTFLISILPFGEGRAGVSFAAINGLHAGLALLIAVIGNIIIFPLMMWLIDTFNHKLWPYRRYKKKVIWLSQLAKRGSQLKIEKYGFWGLMIFVMIPLPGTGAYMGTIAAVIMKMERRKAFLAVGLGSVISCLIVWSGIYLGMSLF
jgi:uncharacterized membrane protein